jgi:hypothetical protein
MENPHQVKLMHILWILNPLHVFFMSWSSWQKYIIWLYAKFNSVAGQALCLRGWSQLAYIYRPRIRLEGSHNGLGMSDLENLHHSFRMNLSRANRPIYHPIQLIETFCMYFLWLKINLVNFLTSIVYIGTGCQCTNKPNYLLCLLIEAQWCWLQPGLEVRDRGDSPTQFEWSQAWITGNPLTTRPLINHSSCAGEVKQIGQSALPEDTEMTEKWSWHNDGCDSQYLAWLSWYCRETDNDRSYLITFFCLVIPVGVRKVDVTARILHDFLDIVTTLAYHMGMFCVWDVHL